MKMKRGLFLILLLFFSCRLSKNNQQLSCDHNNAIAIADNMVMKAGYKLSELQRKVEHDTTTYRIIYILKDSLIEGGGAEIIIGKDDCRILDSKFYQ